MYPSEEDVDAVRAHQRAHPWRWFFLPGVLFGWLIGAGFA